ncbi:SDR family NAD(P)-dependent oxidoreductase [Spongiactinospora gelatinilytica]|uniref:SDR family NAD(P)-dependent oxidoreductase n=1 Tax=Spongiactinospora gelatinilytica TaxID=2666298 RepID=UPI001F27D601|nr:SDR family NAD(P)-dependent oxidoreductase [Spongiactinospora gelatinilytica]
MEEPFPRGSEQNGRLAGQVVVVTGAGGGVGRATAARLGREGALVALIARGGAEVSTAAVEVGAAGGSGIVYETDVADYEQVSTAAERIETDLGPIDVWINVPDAAAFARFTDAPPQEFRRATAATFLGCAWGTRVALDLMRPRGRGTIVQAGSALAYRGVPGRSAYCAAEHAIRGMTESIRSELREADSPLKITTVRLPAPDAGPFKSRDHGQEAADALVFAACHPEREEYRADTVTALITRRLTGGRGPWSWTDRRRALTAAALGAGTGAAIAALRRRT